MMAPEAIMRELSTAIREVVRPEADDAAIEEAACRVILALDRRGVTLVSTVKARHGDAALRIFEALTRWIQRRPEYKFVTEDTGSGVSLTVREGGEIKCFFRGSCVHDAYAQAAQTITFDETL